MMLLIVVSCAEKGIEYSLVEKSLIEENNLVEVNTNFYELVSDDDNVKEWFDAINSFTYNNIIDKIDTLQKHSLADRKMIPEGFHPYILYISDTVCFKNNFILSILSTDYTFMGGAHGITQLKAYNYDLINKKILSADEILNLAEENKINTLLEKYMHNPDSCFTKKPTIKDVAAVNFMEEFMAFSYEQYILGPYSCGILTIKVPIKELKPYMLINPNLSKGDVPLKEMEVEELI